MDEGEGKGGGWHGVRGRKRGSGGFAQLRILGLRLQHDCSTMQRAEGPPATGGSA